MKWYTILVLIMCLDYCGTTEPDMDMDSLSDGGTPSTDLMHCGTDADCPCGSVCNALGVCSQDYDMIPPSLGCDML